MVKKKNGAGYGGIWIFVCYGYYWGVLKKKKFEFYCGAILQ
jgi:hypothetical protein